MSERCRPAFLALDDGAVFRGTSLSAEAAVCGELVFNTAMTGYQEVCTDPSYEGQIVLFSAPHIGNVGVNSADAESRGVWVKGVVALEMCRRASSWRSEGSFVTFLEEHGVAWIEGLDTRMLTRHLRGRGVCNACIVVGDGDVPHAIALAQRHVRGATAQACGDGIGGMTDDKKLSVDAGTTPMRVKVAVYDFGVKDSILRMLARRGCNAMLFPAGCSCADIMSWEPDAVVISNGAGDPSSMGHAIRQTALLLATGLPLLGICLGCQLMALACGATTMALKYGHHGVNHPIYDHLRDKVYVTSQNHLYAIVEESLPRHCIVTHRSLFDGTVQGFRLAGLPVFALQGHPEGAPGPNEAEELFDDFLLRVRHAVGPIH